MVGAAYPWFVSEPDMADVTDVLPLALSSPTAVGIGSDEHGRVPRVGTQVVCHSICGFS